jgi:hypothetical protein
MLKLLKIIKASMNTRLKCSYCLLLIAYCLLQSTPSVFAQNWKFFKKNDALDCRFFSTDALNNIYIITSKNEILKYGSDGSFEARFVNLKMGKLAQLDALNPMKLMVYYPDFQIVQLLDNELNSLGSVNLLDAGVARVGAGKVWVYDAGTNKLMTLNDKKAQAVSSAVVPFAGSTPTQMLFKNNTLYVNIPTKGIYTFDRFGKYLKLLDIKNASHFQVFDNQFFYTKNGQCARFNLQTLKSTPMVMPEGIVGNEPLRLEKKWLFVQKGKTIVIHQEE